MKGISKIPVAMLRVETYNAAELDDAVAKLFSSIGLQSVRAVNVLVKPNLLAATPPDFLPCTHPALVRAVCLHLLNHGALVRVGDSPSFGKGTGIADKIGLTRALSDLPVALVDLDRPKKIRLPFGGTAPLSSWALDSDFIFNLPKLKTHHMAGVTAAVKNLFGCVSGLNKAFSHVRYGDRGADFERLLLELTDVLPPVVSLIDGVTAMHGNGPVGGKPYQLNLLAASRSTAALDTAVYHTLGLKPEGAPLWSEALNRGQPGTRIEELNFPLESPERFDASGFVIHQRLRSFLFLPGGRARRRLKRIRDAVIGRGHRL